MTWDLGGPGIEIKNVENPTPEQANRCLNNTVFDHSHYNPTKGAIYICSIKNNMNAESTVVNNLADSIYGWWKAKPLGALKLFTNNDTSFNAGTGLVSTNWHDFRPATNAVAIIRGGVAVEGISPNVGTNAPDIGAYQHGEQGNVTYWIPGQRLSNASYPIVPDKAQDVPLDRDELMWRPAFGAVSHVVTFATSEDGLNQSAAPTIQKTFQGEENVFALPPLTKGQSYFWRVDAVMPDKSVVKGNIWTFATK